MVYDVGDYQKDRRIRVNLDRVSFAISCFILFLASRPPEVSSWSIFSASSERNFSRERIARNLYRRRDCVAGAASFLLLPSSCQAIGEGDQRMVLTQKPTAPLGALIPAAQQRLLLEKCLYLSQQLISKEKTENGDGELIANMKAILAQPPASVSRRRNDLQVLQQSPPNRLLQGDVTRAAMNIYTSSLSFPGNLPGYTVTDPTWKKSYIRQNDGLPNVAQVLEADLDLRDLYRNSVVTKLDDASAELYISNSIDVAELNNLLKGAAADFDLWLGRIEDVQVEQALQAVLEGKTSKIYDSYYAGFVPPISSR